MTPRLHPVARYADPRAAIRFFERAFGFAVRAVFDAPDGGVAHAELTFGTGTIGLSSVGPVDPSNIWTTVRDGIYACIADPDAHCVRATAGGARIEQPPRDTSYGSREYTARDLEGRLWSFGTYSMNDLEGPPVFTPELRYRDAARAVRFLSSAFDLVPGLAVRNDRRGAVRYTLRGTGLRGARSGRLPVGIQHLRAAIQLRRGQCVEERVEPIEGGAALESHAERVEGLRRTLVRHVRRRDHPRKTE